jgi:hypothetical protein
MTSSLRLIPGAKRQDRQYSRVARLTWTSGALPEIRDEQKFFNVLNEPLKSREPSPEEKAPVADFVGGKKG